MKSVSTIMNEKQAALYLGLSVRTLQAYRLQMKAPAYIKFDKAVRYRREDLDSFLEASRVKPVM